MKEANEQEMELLKKLADFVWGWRLMKHNSEETDFKVGSWSHGVGTAAAAFTDREEYGQALRAIREYAASLAPTQGREKVQ